MNWICTHVSLLSCLEYSIHHITASLVHASMILCAGLPVTEHVCRRVFTMSFYTTALTKSQPNFHSTVTSFNGQNGMHIKCSQWAECQEWQMWFKISSPAFITVNAFSRECHFIPKVCLSLGATWPKCYILHCCCFPLCHFPCLDTEC